MTEADAIGPMFGGMEKLGPGSDEDTQAVLQALPRSDFSCVVDAGCGSGRQTLALARALDTTVHALDTYAPFLGELTRKAAEQGVADRVRTHCLGMERIAQEFSEVDLLWAEASAYSIGFGKALDIWREALVPGGLLVVSELCWLQSDPAAEARVFWEREYPGMQSRERIIALAQQLGYTLLDTHPLPKQTWFEGYYEVLAPRAQRLLQHDSEEVRAMARAMQEEISIIERYHGSFGYLFLSLQLG